MPKLASNRRHCVAETYVRPITILPREVISTQLHPHKNAVLHGGYAPPGLYFLLSHSDLTVLVPALQWLLLMKRCWKRPNRPEAFWYANEKVRRRLGLPRISPFLIFCILQAALDQSGGSTPKALKAYGVPDDVSLNCLNIHAAVVVVL